MIALGKINQDINPLGGIATLFSFIFNILLKNLHEIFAKSIKIDIICERG